MSVDAATAQMANTTLNDAPNAEGASVGAGGDKPINASQNEAVIASAAEGRRLYIGNLAYATTEGELKDFFKDYLVETTSIPTNPAERAINELNGKTILDRKVSVQLARKPEPAAEGGEGAEGTRRRSSTRGRGRGRGRAGRGGRAGRARKSGEAEAADESTAPATNGDASAPTNVPGQVIPLTETTNEALSAQPGQEGTITVDPAETGKSNAPRPRKQRGPPEDGVPSKTKEKLLEIFADYNPSSAKIALRPIPRFMVRKLQARNEPRKGRGFGFVTLASEEMQKKACDEMNGKEIEGREIAVKVAIDSPGKEDEDPSAPIEGAAETDGNPSTAEGSANTAAAVAQ
ncbi:hypothetical protein H2203_006391 [Taxawa tesnikishii (nom. ined.)]|nr:hypothetical protein H2203_006391 [Dothideales sp. JES 119]